MLGPQRQELRAWDRRIEAMSEYAQALSWSEEFNERFVEYFSGIPCNDEYYLLYNDCWARFAVLGTGPNPRTVQEVLETFGPPQRSANVESCAHTGEHSYRSPPLLSPRPPMFNSLPNRNVRLVPTEREVLGTSLSFAREPNSAQLSHQGLDRDALLESQCASNVGLAVPKQPEDLVMGPVRAAAKASMAIQERPSPSARVEACKRAGPSSMTPGTPPHIRKLPLCGSRQAHCISQSFSGIGTPSSGRRQSVGTVGFNGPPDGSPRFGKTPICGIASPSVSPSGREVPVSIPVKVQQPVKSRGVVSGTEPSVTKCLPGAGVALALPKPLPVCSVRTAPSRSPVGESQPLFPAVSKSLRQPGKKAVVNKSQTGMVGHSPVALVAPTPLHLAPITPKHAMPLSPVIPVSIRLPETEAVVISKEQMNARQHSFELKAALPLPRHLTSVPVKKATQSKHAIPFRLPNDESVPLVGHEAVGKAKQLSRAVYGGRLPCERPECCPECSPECSDTKRGLAVEQAQALFPGEEGEEQWACIAFISKISEASKAARSPESLMPLAIPTAESTLPAQTAAPCQHVGEAPLPIEEALVLQLVRTPALCTPDMSDRHIQFPLTVI
ncbi:hypothetical protein AX14_007707 [Amanita brunnescens Koide BX004]|nr:hypothetical protein AX14_007707 [Amanita brunnescens Koide BX004]